MTHSTSKSEGHALKISKEELRTRYGRILALLNSFPELVFFKDRGGQYLECNDAFSRLLGYSKDELLTLTDRDLTPVYSELRAQQDQEVLNRQVTLQAKVHWQPKHRPAIEVNVTLSPVVDETGKVLGILGVGRDMTSQSGMEERLRYMAYHDALTNLPNRLLLADRVSMGLVNAVRRKTLLAVCYIDLDGFKPVNDIYGHAIGDRLLIEIGSRLTECLRAGDTVARLGGDEFAILLTDLTDEERAKTLLERLLSIIEMPFHLGSEVTVSVSASIGFTVYPLDYVDGEVLLRHADLAMYQAKMNGGNQICRFSTLDNRGDVAKITAQNEVARALTAGELVLYFQPQVDMRRRTVVGLEALLRWNHPQRGVVVAGEFLPKVEDAALRVQIGEWVLERAFESLQIWQSKGFSLRLGINIDAKHLLHPNFPSGLRRVLEKFPTVNREFIELELLETVALDDMGRVTRIMNECRQLGIRFAIDNFGTAYSSMAYLKRVPADTIKIDISFIRDILENPDSLAVVEGILGLTKAFRRHAVAEGVETAEHTELLLYLGCDFAQGYAFARPMPADQIVGWLQSFEMDPVLAVPAVFPWDASHFALFRLELMSRSLLGMLAKTGKSFSSNNLRSLMEGVSAHVQAFRTWYNGPAHSAFGPNKCLEEMGVSAESFFAEINQALSLNLDAEDILDGLRALLESATLLAEKIDQFKQSVISSVADTSIVSIT